MFYLLIFEILGTVINDLSFNSVYKHQHFVKLMDLARKRPPSYKLSLYKGELENP